MTTAWLNCIVMLSKITQKREVNVIDGVAVCAVILYTDTQADTDRHTGRTANIIISSNSLRSVGGDN